MVELWWNTRSEKEILKTLIKGDRYSWEVFARNYVYEVDLFPYMREIGT